MSPGMSVSVSGGVSEVQYLISTCSQTLRRSAKEESPQKSAYFARMLMCFVIALLKTMSTSWPNSVLSSSAWK